MRALQTEDVNLNQIIALTIEQAKSRYNCGANVLYEVAEKAGAVIRIGAKKKLYSRQKLDRYFEEELTEY
jgi:hypothetical protein